MFRSAARRLAPVAPLLALLFFVAALALRPMAESDLFFRIKAGQQILRHHGLPGRNLFSFTYPDGPDLDTAWLFEVGAAIVWYPSWVVMSSKPIEPAIGVGGTPQGCWGT